AILRKHSAKGGLVHTVAIHSNQSRLCQALLRPAEPAPGRVPRSQRSTSLMKDVLMYVPHRLRMSITRSGCGRRRGGDKLRLLLLALSGRQTPALGTSAKGLKADLGNLSARVCF